MESGKINMALDDIIKDNKRKDRGIKRQSFTKRDNKKSFGLRRKNFNNFGDRENSNNISYKTSNFNRNNNNSFRKRNPRNNKFRENRHQNDLKPFNKPDWRRNNRRKRRLSNHQESKIIISNLHYNISNDDLANLFSEFGRIKRCGIFWDKVGVSKGEAYVEFYNRKDAESSINQMNGKIIEGMNINVELKSY